MKSIVVAVLVAGTVVAEPTNELDVLRKSYESAEARLDMLVVDAYRKVLVSAMADTKKSGDLDGYGIIDAERKRLDAEKTVPVTNSIPDVYAGMVLGVLNDWSVRKIDLLKRYIAALDVLLKKEMSNDRMEAAKAVKDEKVKAEFLLAEAESRLPMAEKNIKAEKLKAKSKYPDVSGTWIEGSGVLQFTQTGNSFRFKETGPVAGFGEVVSEGTGSVTEKREFTASARYVKAPKNWQPPKYVGTVSDDGRTIRGTATWKGGAREFMFTRQD